MSWPADTDALLDSPSTQERFARDEYMPYWAQPWPAAVILAERVLAGPCGDNRSAIELGCGVGLVSVAAGRVGWRVVASDYDEDAVAFAQYNASRNGLTLSATTTLDYRDPPTGSPFHLVLAADLLYERRHAAPLARWIAAALTPEGTALISDPNRSAADGFPDIAVAAGLDCECEPVETVHPSTGLTVRGRVWTLSQRSGS
jgi:predicted nicotinamide N-methyase